MRNCDCVKDKGFCFCISFNNHLKFETRDVNGEPQSKWRTVNEAVRDGRNRFKKKFEVYDNQQQKIILRNE